MDTDFRADDFDLREVLAFLSRVLGVETDISMAHYWCDFCWRHPDVSAEDQQKAENYRRWLEIV